MKMKRFLLILMIPMMFYACSDDKKSPNLDEETTGEDTTENADNEEVIELCTAKDIIEKMYPGVNIGNTLEAIGGETSWGNPQVDKTYVQGLKNLGFRAVRIPCSWDQYIVDKQNYTIDPEWLARVKEVVTMVVDEDLYAILNIHWDGGWLEDNISQGYDAEIDKKQGALWTQIASYLEEFDEHLLFAGCNEPGMNEKAGEDEESVKTIMAYEQTFVDAVRATGGRNATRVLVVQGLETDIAKTCNSTIFKLPNDEVEDRIMLEVHYYDPYQFTIMGSDESWGKVFYYWGSENHVSDDADHSANWGEEDWVAERFDQLKESYIDKGYCVIIGEYSAEHRTAEKYENMDEDKHNASRKYFNEVVTQYAIDRGIVPFYWETGVDINRSDGSAKEDYAIEGIMDGVKKAEFSCK